MLSLVSEIGTVALTASSVLGMGLRIVRRVESVIKTLEAHGKQIEEFEERLVELEKLLRDLGSRGKSPGM